MELPLVKNTLARKSPKLLIIYSPPKVGKTSLLAELDNCLIADLEEGTDHVSAMAVKVKSYKELHQLCEEVKKANRPYLYGALDTTTALEDMVMPLALWLYQQTAMGKTYTGNILALPNGGGYLYLREAFKMMLDKFKECFDRVILLGHIKDKMIEKAGKEVSAKDIDLTGKLRQIVCANADAIGYLYREKNQNILSFQTSEELICGARPVHLRNKKIVISEYDEAADRVTAYWEKIYID